MATTNSPRLGIPKPDENSTPDVPRDLSAAVDRIDAIAMSVDVGPLSSEPPSSPSTPGTAGHAMVVTDQALTGPRLDVDTGTGFFTVGPAPVDAAPTVPSSRTLGQGAQQACAGNDPRLVGGAQATGDVSGPYPGPLTVNTWGGQNKAQVIASSPPQLHASSHLAAGTDPINGITDTQIAPGNKDGPAATPGMRTLGQGAQQACAGNDPRLGAPSPIGSIVAYAGTGDPPEADWVIADGRLIDRTVYAAFYARVGHVYNNGVDPGGNKVKIPDKRGKHSIGAINMGTTAGLADNAHAQVARGAVGGEAVHSLAIGEVPAHAHPISDPGHGHNINDPQHGHNFYELLVANTSGQSTTGSVNGSTGGGSWNWSQYTGPAATGISVVGNATGITGTNNAGGTGPHNNLGPYEADSYIVRIA